MKHFTMEELTRSETAARRGIDNTPDGTARAALVTLTERTLDPLRELWGAPLRVNSGYRCAALNRAVGGTARSHHLRGMAADITAGSRTANARLFRMAGESATPFTQLIAEQSDREGPRWVHISFDPADVRRQILKLP